MKNAKMNIMKTNIILFTQPGCPQCRMVHMMLDKNGIEYQENQDVDVMKSKGIDHTPALEVDGKILKGKEIFTWINEVK